MENVQNMQPHQIYNILLLGMLGVGKSALTVKYITRRFINEYHPFIEGTYSKVDVVDGDETLLRIFDSGTPDDTPENITQQYSQKLEWADATMVVYSINNHQSFEYARDLLNELSKMNLNAKTFLVCNKVDMEIYRQVSREDSEQIAFDYGVSLRETCSCGDYDLVKSIFHDAVREVRKSGTRNSRKLARSKSRPALSPVRVKINPDDFSRFHQDDIASSLPSSYISPRKGSESSPILNDVTDAMLFGNYNNNNDPSGTHYGSYTGIHKKALSLSDDALEFSALQIMDNPSGPSSGRTFQHALVSNAKSTSSLKEKFSSNSSTKGRRHTGFSLFNNKFKIF